MNEPRPAISAAIVARNEEANLPGCPETLRRFDEIVLVDMESEDRTVAVKGGKGAA